MTPSSPRGVICILIDDKGRVASTGVDFKPDTPGGCELWFGQRYRARLYMCGAFIRAYASECIARAMSDYHVEELVGTLTREHGWRVTIRAIGYDEDSRHEIDSN